MACCGDATHGCQQNHLLIIIYRMGGEDHLQYPTLKAAETARDKYDFEHGDRIIKMEIVKGG